MSDNLISQKLDKYLKNTESLDKIMLDSISIYIYSLEHKKNDLYLIFKVLGEEAAYKLINYFGGDNLRVPSKQELKDAKLLNLVFYLKIMLNYSWKEIKSFLNLDNKSNENYETFNSWEIDNFISIGKKLNNIKNELLNAFSSLQNINYDEKYKKMFVDYLLKD